MSLSSVRSEVFLWGGGINVPFPMPLPPEDDITQIATGRNQQVAITKEGKLIVWEVGIYISVVVSIQYVFCFVC